MKKKIFLLLIILVASVFPGNVRVEAEQASTTKEWIPQAYLPDKITAAAVAAVDRKIYVIGGTSSGRSINTTYVYDQDSKKWTEKASIPLTVSAASVAVVGKKIYVIGGTSGSTYRKSVQIYDTQMIHGKKE
ncbi:kelch repeat-containing protein [Bacillus paralicheniformis]|uniref:kelch repeat-containing protein n=1 Tax=Bacillus paralicheniformis TaxID=1648923 RepID=UPI0017486248|nr:kelch repeat-containing protein [Bacillus paralicheniformis]